jgi:cytochrome c oxidase cbb3-type subunit III
VKRETEENKLTVLEDEKHLLLDHDYDDIQELNHPLPNWWNGIFIVCCVFALAYFVYYQFGFGPTLRDEFKEDYKVVVSQQEEFKRLNSAFDPAYYEKLVGEGAVAKGKEVYEINCMPCHSEKGQGDVGPNLTDDHWLLAKGTPETIYAVVFNGSEENGMPVWGDLISKDEIYQAVAYVMTFKNTFVKGKAPQGEKVE